MAELFGNTNRSYGKPLTNCSFEELVIHIQLQGGVLLPYPSGRGIQPHFCQGLATGVECRITTSEKVMQCLRSGARKRIS